jgi:hypothetical protein
MAYATMAAADADATLRMSNGTATVAHSQHDKDGVLSVRLLRPVSWAGFSASSKTVDGENKGGAWDVVYDAGTP